MATYGCRLYQNTGFNAVNIPDSPALLEQCAHFDVSALSIMQNRFLKSVRVRATWQQVKDCDYIRIDNDYYFITGMNMLATDCCELSVLYDFITSAGGVTGFSILDGITSRVHVPVSDDTFGKYTENDPLTLPAQPLEIQLARFSPSTNAHTYVEATVNLAKCSVAADAEKYTYIAGEEEDSVVVPEVVNLDNFTQYSLSGLNESVNPHTMLYDLNNTDTASGADLSNQAAIEAGKARVRALGIEQGAIVNQVQIPLVYAECLSGDSTTSMYGHNSPDGDKTTTNRSINKFTGKKGDVSSGINYEYTGAVNNRVNYGEYTKYGLISCSGESCEFKAEDIKDPQNATSPRLKYMADPHTDGKPYFRWRWVNGDASDIGFFRNAITGLQWKQVPLYFRDPSGTAINTMKYQNSRNIGDVEKENRYNLRKANAADMIMSGAGSGFASGRDTAGGVVAAIGGTFDAGFKALNTLVPMQRADDLYYAAQKQSEMADYLVQNTVAAPTINFPFNSELLRDFYGNGCLMYRYKYTSADINRIDKMLTMYGYKFTKALETSDFTNRPYFNYVECANVTVTGHAKWMNDGIGMMLSNGVRIWHTLPNPAIYTSGNA